MLRQGDEETRRQGESAVKRVSLSFRLCLCGYFLFSAVSASAAVPLVVPVEGEPFGAELVSIDANGRVTFLPVAAATSPDASSPRLLSLDELVRWGHLALPRAQTLVVLADGGRLVTAADWSGGAAVRLNGDAVVVHSDTLGEVRLPRTLVSGVVFANRNHPRDRERLEQLVRSSVLAAAEAGEPDVVLLTNKNRLVGDVTELAGGSLTIATDAGPAKLPLSRTEAVIFGKSQANGDIPKARPDSTRLIVGLRDGSLLYAHSIRANAKELVLEAADGLKLAGENVSDMVLLQSLGRRFVYLSDLAPADYRHVAYLSIEWPYRRDRNVLREPLVVDGKRYLKGVGMHSAARLTYRLEGKYRQFDAAVALDDSAGRRGSVTFGVYLLRDGQWKESYTSGIVRGADEPEPVSVDVSGADGLTLTVDFADRGDELDHADWLDARLVKN